MKIINVNGKDVDITKEAVKVYEDEDFVFSFSIDDNYKENQEQSRRELADAIARVIRKHYKHLVKKG